MENRICDSAATPVATHIHAFDFGEFQTNGDAATADRGAIVARDKKSDFGLEYRIEPRAVALLGRVELGQFLIEFPDHLPTSEVADTAKSTSIAPIGNGHIKIRVRVALPHWIVAPMPKEKPIHRAAEYTKQSKFLSPVIDQCTHRWNFCTNKTKMVSLSMPKDTPTRRRKRGTYTLGRKRFAKISAVEGIDMSSVEREFEDFDRRKLSPDERRREIVRKYGAKH